MLFLALIWARPGKGCSVCSGKWRYDFFGLYGLSALASTASMAYQCHTDEKVPGLCPF